MLHETDAVLVDLWRLLEEEGAPVSVARRGVADLLAEGLLAFSDAQIAFTDKGRERATVAVRRTRLAEVLLARTLDRGAPEDCGRGVPLAAGFEDQVCAFLDHPRQCPHGKAIPPAAGCCVPALALAAGTSSMAG